jgi:hypothetical protein
MQSFRRFRAAATKGLVWAAAWVPIGLLVTTVRSLQLGYGVLGLSGGRWLY